MYLQEKHKEFAVRSFAKFMSRSDVAEAFIEEFPHDIPKPEPKPVEPDFEKDTANIENEFNKDEYTSKAFAEIHQKYHNLYGPESAEEKLREHMPQINQQLEDEYAQHIQNLRKARHEENMDMYNFERIQYNGKVQKIIANRLRRYNITDTQFPKKYQKLFNDSRKEFLTQAYKDVEIQDIQNITEEFHTLYGYLKNYIFRPNDAQVTATNVRNAITLLKAIGDNITK